MTEVPKARDMTVQQSILERLAVPNYPNVYWIGRKAVRLTFLSQQQRALNLIWALHDTGKLPPGAEVVVVGAGLAGLTAAFAAKKLGAAVALIEKKPVPLHLQRGCQLRFVHPNILDWPAQVSESPITNLPCLNWGAGMAARVSSSILEQWRNLEPIEECCGYEVREIRNSAGGRPLVLAEGESRNLERPCDLLILGVGFGLERALPPAPFLSYWENDNLGRPLIRDPIPRRYLVTGCGDGGLIDAIRLRLNAFDHADFVYELSSLRGLDKIKEQLLQIDRNVATQLRGDKRIDAKLAEIEKSVNLGIGKTKAKLRIATELEGQLLEEEYRCLQIPDALKDLLTQDLRSDTTVFLNSPSISPLNLKSSILNRFVVFLLRQYGGLRYRAGEVTVSPVAAGQAFRISFQHDQFPVEELEVHEVVVRHGPIPAIGRLFPKSAVEACQAGPEDWEDPTREQQYPSTFLSRPDLDDLKKKVLLEYAITISPLAAREQFDPLQHDRFGLQVAQGEVSYVLRSIRTTTESGAPRSFFNAIPFQLDPPLEPVAPPAPTRSVRLFSGAGIQNIGSTGSAPAGGSSGHFGTLGCFVHLSSGELGILTTAHALGDPRVLQKGDQIVRAGEPDQAKVIATVHNLLIPRPSSPQSTIAADTVRFNRVDAAVATLAPSIRIDAGFGKIYPDAPSLSELHVGVQMEALLGADVFKVGAASGLTRGRIEDVEATLRLPMWGDQYWYEGLFIIKSSDSQPFCLPGDDGALVVRSDGTVLGLVISGSPSATFAMPIRPVLMKLECELYLGHRRQPAR